MTTITAIVSDTHIGGTTALAPPAFENAEGQVIKATRAQNWLYRNWLEYWEYVRKLTEKHNARLIVLHLGDILDGDHHQTVQALPNVVDQENMAFEILEPLALRSDKFFIFRGTEAHAGPAAGSEVRIAERLGAIILPIGRLDIDGTLINVAHHGRASKREWTSSAASVATQAQLKALRRKLPPPRYVFRGHNHIIDDSGEKLNGTRAISMPAWQLATDYIYSIDPDTIADIGGVIILPDGSLDLSRLRYQAAPGEREVVRV